MRAQTWRLRGLDGRNFGLHQILRSNLSRNLSKIWWNSGQNTSWKGSWGPKSPELAPRGTKTGPRGNQGVSRWPQGGQKGLQDCPKRAHGVLKLGLWDHFDVVFLWFLVKFWANSEILLFFWWENAVERKSRTFECARQYSTFWGFSWSGWINKSKKSEIFWNVS